jgi:D-3-phosphoglycerate dehydrogenase
LDDGQLRGACLDVFENEAIHSYSDEEKSMISALARRSNVQFSTHIAGWTHQSKFKLAKILIEKIAVLL